MPLLPQSIADLVAQDGVARQVTADDGSVHMLFRDGAIVRSCLLADWPAMQIELAAHEQDRTDAAALRQEVLTTLQTAVGIPFGNLSAAQLKAVVEALAWKAGALNKDTTVRPPGQWL